MIKILVVEDEQRVAELLKRGLEESDYQVEPACDGIWGLRLFRAGELQMVISDIILLRMSGFEPCKEMRNINSRIPVLMLAALGTMDDKFDGFDAGANDYMIKPSNSRGPNACIKVLLKWRLPGISETQLTELVYADLRIDRQTKTVHRQEREIKLSPKEYNLLFYMAENPERLLTHIEIADKVQNTHFDTGTNFIDIYISYLRKKIDQDYDVRLIHIKLGMGFIFRQEL